MASYVVALYHEKARSAQPKVVLKSAVGALAPTSPERLLIADSVNSAPIYGTNMGIYFFAHCVTHKVLHRAHKLFCNNLLFCPGFLRINYGSK